ncbi:MAG: hypothetical protein LC645_07925, partial [Geobacteraceae bacterium]|nr:hypothetical protein [Geobacteraceae bacterium]
MQDTDISLRSSKRLALTAFALTCVMLILMGIAFYQYQRRGALRSAQENLRVAHDLYTRQISYWRTQHLALAQMLASDSRFRHSAAALAAREPGSDIAFHREQLRSILGAMRHNYEYHHLLLADRDGNPLVNSPHSSREEILSFRCGEMCRADIELSLELNQGVFSSVHLHNAAADV